VEASAPAHRAFAERSRPLLDRIANAPGTTSAQLLNGSRQHNELAWLEIAGLVRWDGSGWEAVRDG